MTSKYLKWPKMTSNNQSTSNDLKIAKIYGHEIKPNPFWNYWVLFRQFYLLCLSTWSTWCVSKDFSRLVPCRARAPAHERTLNSFRHFTPIAPPPHSLFRFHFLMRGSKSCFTSTRNMLVKIDDKMILGFRLK